MITNLRFGLRFGSIRRAANQAVILTGSTTTPETTARMLATQPKRPVWYKDLAVMNQLAGSATPPAYANLNMANTAVLFIGHALQTTYNVVETILNMGVPAGQMVMTGKSYSQNNEVVEAIKTLGVSYLNPSSSMPGKFNIGFDRDIHNLWALLETIISEKSNIENVIVLDHSGKGVQYMPPSMGLPTIGIAKTTADVFMHEKSGVSIPVINMAQSCVKKKLESPMIAQAVLHKINHVIPELLSQTKHTEKPTCGVLGAGAIGGAVAKRLANLGHQVMVYDTNESLSKTLEAENPAITALKSSCQVYATTRIIFGCTGAPTDALDPLDCQIGPKTLISCSSDDTEFKHTLSKPTRLRHFPSGHITYTNPNGTVHTIVQGGFPANFDHSGESVPAPDIDITRALTLASVYQAMLMLQQHQSALYPQLYMLDPELQQAIATLWLQEDGISLTEEDCAKAIKNFTKNPDSLSWITEQSGGAAWTPTLYKTPPSHPALHLNHESSSKNSIDDSAQRQLTSSCA